MTEGIQIRNSPRYRLKPGSEEAVLALSKELARRPTGSFVAGYFGRIEAAEEDKPEASDCCLRRELRADSWRHRVAPAGPATESIAKRRC